MKKPMKFLDGCEDCDKNGKKIKHLWVLVWPNRRFLSRNLVIPAAFYTKMEAMRFKFNSTYDTPILIKFKVT